MAQGGIRGTGLVVSGAVTSLAEEGHDAILDVVVAPGPSDQVTTACEDVMQEASKQRMAT